MIRTATKKIPRAKPQTDDIVSRGIPSKGLNTVSPYGSMTDGDAIALNNGIVESFGIRTRKGYSEWAIGLPTANPIRSMLNYYPASYDQPEESVSQYTYLNVGQLEIVSPRAADGPGPGQIFAAQDTFIYDVTAGGTGPWVPEAGVVGAGPLWNGINWQNVAGSFLLIANEEGGYAIYDGAAWSMPTFGTNPGQVSGVDPADIVWVAAWKERVWFFTKNSTSAYYLPVGQITGIATEFPFGNAMDHGGSLSWLGGFTIDGGIGVDDYLVAVGSQGDVIVYKGTDPNDVSSFALHGVWYAGPLPVGFRAVEGQGDVLILTQFGAMSVSSILQPTNVGAQINKTLTQNIDPLIASLMRDFSSLEGWQVTTIAKEELILIRVPELANTYIANSWLAYKTTTKTWSVLSALPYGHIVNTGSLAYAGTLDGRVVRAFNGPLDNVDIDGLQGVGIQCRVTASYSNFGTPGRNKIIKMVRPVFVSASLPKISTSILSNFLPPTTKFFPTIPTGSFGGRWDVDLWDVGVWSGGLRSLNEWFGVQGWGYSMTLQLDYTSGGDTVLMGVDYWLASGGVM